MNVGVTFCIYTILIETLVSVTVKLVGVIDSQFIY